MTIRDVPSTWEAARQLVGPAPVALLAAPALLVAAAALLLGGWAVGWNPLWPAIDYNLSEAVYLRDRGAVLDLMKRGEPLDPRYPVRPGLARSFEVMLTPLEAAVAGRELFMVQFLIEHGAEVSADERVSLVCFAQVEHAEETVAWLLDGSAMPDCSRIEIPWTR